MLERLRMPSKKQYDLVSDDGYDSRIPLHNDEAFQHGIPFQAKYIGTLDVPRPSSRVEIVAAMRRIRYEFKAKAIKKKKVTVTVSVEGVKVVIRKKKRRKQDWASDESRSLVMNHPIYRIFYVSHDSQDLKIFSYIARDGSTNVFKCNVFKAYKKSQAMRIVRTIGQAFEVCHKISIHSVQQESNDVSSEKSSKHTEDTQGKHSVSSPEKVTSVDASPVDSKPSTETQSPMEAFQQAQDILQHVGPRTHSISSSQKAVGTLSTPHSPKLTDSSLIDMGPLPLTAQHKIQLLRQQVEQQQQHTQVAMAQVQLLKDQLTAETTSRIEAQARCHNLLIQNRELLDHINALVRQMQEMEARITGTDLEEYNLMKTPIQRIPMPEVTSPEPGPVFIPGGELDLSSISMIRDNSGYDYPSPRFYNDSQESPDSGHKEMSSDSLVYSHIHGNDSSSSTMGGHYGNDSNTTGVHHGTVWHSPASRFGGSVIAAPGSGAGRSFGGAGVVRNSPQQQQMQQLLQQQQQQMQQQVVGGFNAIDAGYQKPYPVVGGGVPKRADHASPYTVNSNGNPFIQQNNNVINSNGNYIQNGFDSDSHKSSTASEKTVDQENNNTTKINGLLASQPQDGCVVNKADLNITPKLDPPPRNQRSSRSPSCGKEVVNSSDTNGNDSSNMSVTTSSNSLSEKRISRDSAKLTLDDVKSQVTDNNSNNKTGEIKELNTIPRLNKDLDKEGNETSTANQNLKNLNLNLKTLKSPHKRHSSTSAELYGNKDTSDVKIAMQSASESRLTKMNVSVK